jgi:1-acyl-sn-glycerol-3-phosphate acyltransferase
MGSPTITDVVWAASRLTIGTAARTLVRLRHYGLERIPRQGGLVLALNHFSAIDPAVFAVHVPRRVVYVAKIEAHLVPGLGQLIRSHGTLAIRRGESDRDAVRRMRAAVREGLALGMFVEGTRQRAGVPGAVRPGAAMVALQEGVPLVVGAVEGSQRWRLGNFGRVSVAWSEPLDFSGLPRNARGYREASAEIQGTIMRLWEFLVRLHDLGRPRAAVPPRR